MSVRIERIEDDDEAWERCVDRSGQTTLFHRMATLRVLADHAGATLHPLAGYKGQEPVGVFPVFELRKGPLTGVFSPPPYLSVPYLGPAFCNVDKLKQRKADRRKRRFLESCLEWIDETVSPRYQQYVTGRDFDDARSFVWSGNDLTVEYTYVVDLTTDASALLAQFSSDARRNVKDGEGVDADLSVGGVDDARRIVDQVRRRYEEQDRPYGITPSFVAELYRALPDGAVRPYVCRVEDEFVGGILSLWGDDTVYRWQGGVRPEREVDFPVNDHLDWRIMGDGVTGDVSRYDLVGAGVPRINEYKAKFNPELRSFYRIEGGTWPVPSLVNVYRQVS